MTKPNRSSRYPIAACGDGRAIGIYRRLTDAAHPRISVTSSKTAVADGDTGLTNQWTLLIDRPDAEMVGLAARDLKRFLKNGFGISFSESRSSGKAIRVFIDPVRGRVSGRSKRDHVISILRDSIEIIGVSEWGAACGLYHLQRLLKLRGAPFVAQGIMRSHPVLEPSLTCLAFKHGDHEEFDYPEAYHENYLIRIARAGYTGFHIDPGFRPFYRSEILPELNHPQEVNNLAILRKVVARARKCALDVFLTPYVPFLPSDNPVFKNHPAVRGSEIVAAKGMHVLCTGRDRVRRFYEEQAARLFRKIPGLGGVFLITGCEGLLHCYTAPAARPENQTNCPHCRHKNPEQTVAKLVNGIAAAVKKVAPAALVTVWPYGASTWTNTAAQKQRHVAAISRDCAFMANFDTGELFKREGVRVMAEDYNLSVVGPSRVFRRQAEVAAKNGLKVMAKVESGCPREIHAIPSIPANTRWVRKYGRILESGASGAMFSWQFCSFTGSLSEELAGWMSWRPCPVQGTLLRRLATREFGVNNVACVMQAWHWFDRAMDHFPYSSATSIFRRGPFGIGFAHPLILDPLRPGELSPDFMLDSYWLTSQDAKQPPKYVADLSWTNPFGADACGKALAKTERAWARGCALLEAAASPGAKDQDLADRLDEHQALGRAILCILRTALNMVRFLDVRDRYFREPSDLVLARQRLTELREIAKRELTNAEDGLRCMRRNVQIGFDYSNRGGFTQAMVQTKLAQTRWLIDWDIPYRVFLHSVSMHARDEWIGDDGKKYR